MTDIERVKAELLAGGHEEWARNLSTRSAEAMDSEKHGLLDQWIHAIDSLPPVKEVASHFDMSAVTFDGELEIEEKELRRLMMTLHPWRKGPFNLFGMQIDTEWRSNLKWERIAPHIDFRDANVLDIGSGNGYFGWRMLGAGARRVIGLEPFPLYVLQHQAIKTYSPDAPNYVVIGTDADVPKNLNAFDITLSMGVLYHRTGPIDHLQSIFHSLRSGGQVVLETLIVDQPGEMVLMPENRYAKMRNVWFLPSSGMLERMMLRTGFRQIRIVDVTQTTIEEQRATDWMTFESLPNFLSADGLTTIEGYPPPLRAIAIARKP